MDSNQKWQDFDCLHEKIIANLNRMQLRHPTTIQSEVFSNYRNYYDFLIASQTGSGKTLAFAAPILSQLLSYSEKLPSQILCLILTPTRELAQQIEKVISSAIQGTHLGLASLMGGLSVNKQARVLRQNRPHIVVGTPGRISELLTEQMITFSSLKYLVIDEADRMIEMGHYIELDSILHKIFNPKIQETFEKDYTEIIENLNLKYPSSSDNFYIKSNGKKKNISLNLHSLQTQKLFELPADMFQIANDTFKIKDTGKNKKKNKQMEQQSLQKPQIQHTENFKKLRRRVFFISATLTREFKGTKYYKKKVSKEDSKDQSQYTPKLKALLSRVKFDSKPKIIDQSAQLFLPKKLKQLHCFCDSDLDKIAILLCYLRQLPQNSKTIIFTNTIKAAKRVTFFIQSAQIKCFTLHSNMIQKKRLTKLQRFKKSIGGILISTDVAARGLDFEITHVVQYSVPINGDTYVHRVGRTARANKTGEALVLINKKQANQWEEIVNAISLNASGQQKVQKYYPLQHKMNSIMEQVQKFEWIRLNDQKSENKRIIKLSEMQAEQMGVVDQEPVKSGKKIDQEEQRIHKQKIEKKIKAYQQDSNPKKKIDPEIGDGKKWKKNKLVMSLDEIKKYL